MGVWRKTTKNGRTAVETTEEKREQILRVAFRVPQAKKLFQALAVMVITPLAVDLASGEERVTRKTADSMDGGAIAVKPTVQKVGDGAKVSFVLSAPNDVEIAVLDAQGRIVRHLAAGVLGGERPPPAPLRPRLDQELFWDGKDGAGSPAHGGPFKFRIRAGMQAEFDGFPVSHPSWIGELRGLTVGPEGELYVYSSLVFSHRGSSRCLQVFTKSGEYLRTIMPPPAGLSRDRVLPFGFLDTGEDGFYPRNYFGTWPEFYPGAVGQLSHRLTPDGKLLLFDHLEIALLATDGGAADNTFRRGYWRGTQPSHYTVPRYFACLTSPDGKFLYLSGLCSAKERSGKDTDAFPAGRVYRMANDQNSAMEKWLDLGGDNRSPHGSTIAGADCDREGNLLVCDWAHDKVRVFSPDGAEIGGFSVEGPELVVCNRKTGAVYVLCSTLSGKNTVNRKLVKFSSWKAAAVGSPRWNCHSRLPTSTRRKAPVFA